MFMWLNKKVVAAPSDSGAVEQLHVAALHVAAWGDAGWLAVGGAAVPASGDAPSSALRLLQLSTSSGAQQPESGPTNTTLPPTVAVEIPLGGHAAPIRVVAWNRALGKLATADDAGLIIVWTYTADGGGSWVEELINRRNGSAVADLKWRADGGAIAIGYADGAAVVGRSDGARIWAKDDVASGRGLTSVTWAPDGRIILFGCGGLVDRQPAAVLMYSAAGAPLGSLPLPALSAVPAGSLSHVVALDWHDMSPGDPSVPALAVAFSNGRVQLMSGEGDKSPVLIDTGLALTSAAWSPDGSSIALAGTPALNGGGAPPPPEVQLYGHTGRYLTALRLPQQPQAPPSTPLHHDSAILPSISAVAWEPTGLRLALTCGPVLYFACVRPDYMWATVASDTIAYAFRTPDREEASAVFLNARTGERHVKYVRRLTALHGPFGGEGDTCVLVCAPEPRSDASTAATGSNDDDVDGERTSGHSLEQQQGQHPAQGSGAAGHLGRLSPNTRPTAPFARTKPPPPHILILCDAIGSPLDSKYLDFQPAYVCVAATYIIAASPSYDALYVWRTDVRNQQISGSGARAGGAASEGAAAVNEPPVANDATFLLDPHSGACVMKQQAPLADGGTISQLQLPPSLEGAAITCVTARADCLLVGRETGCVYRYRLPSMELEGVFNLRCSPAQLQLNADCTWFGVVDSGNVASLYDMTAESRALLVASDGSGALQEVASHGVQSAEEWRDVWVSYTLVLL